MDDAGTMSRGKAVGNLDGDPQALVDRESALHQPLRKRGPFEVLHHEDRAVLVLSEPEQSADVRMADGGKRSRLSIQSLGRIRISGQLAREDFQRDQTTEPRITGLVDLTHASGAERAEKLVHVDARARLEWHWGWTDYVITAGPADLGARGTRHARARQLSSLLRWPREVA